MNYYHIRSRGSMNIIVRKRHNRRGRLLAAAPGTGKGLMALALAELLKSNKIISYIAITSFRNSMDK